jgi:integrase
MLAKWSAKSHSTDKEPFFSMNSSSGHWELNSLHIASAVKGMARKKGFAVFRFSSHSLRYGGATTLAAAGLPDSWIQVYGRWRSLAFLAYIKLSENIFKKVQQTMNDSTQFSHADIAKLMV